jgi:D-alanyl-D-alanine carboxypeptidase/D-alanyl-D-alanine-endopeptidase (penicillin-binding protein 4)
VTTIEKGGRLSIDSATEANARAKTGSIANVRALSGDVTTRDGEPLVFSIVANHFNVPTSTIDETVDRAVERLANFTRKK